MRLHGPPGALIVLRWALAVLRLLDVAEASDMAECRFNSLLIDSTETNCNVHGMALLQQRFDQTQPISMLEVSQGGQSQTRKKKGVRKKKIVHRKLPPFPTLAPEDVALLPSKGASFEEVVSEEEDDISQDAESSSMDSDREGIATVHLDSMTRPRPSNFLEEETEPKPSSGYVSETPKKSEREHVTAAGMIGATASLDEEGYRAIADTAEPKEMEAFVRRVVQSMGLKVLSENGLRIFAAEFASDEEEGQSYAALKAELEYASGRQEAWLGPGKGSSRDVRVSGHTAPLDETGYFAVAALQNHYEMKYFVERVIKELGFEVIDTGDLDGFVSYYSGEKSVQDMGKLEKEIKGIASRPGQWISKKGDHESEEMRMHPRKVAPPR